MSSPGGTPTPEGAIREVRIQAEYEMLVPNEDVRRLFNDAGVSQNVQGIIGRFLDIPSGQSPKQQDIAYLDQQLDSGFDRIDSSTSLDDTRKEQARNAFFIFAAETPIGNREPVLKLTAEHVFKNELGLSAQEAERYYPVAKAILERFGSKEELSAEEIGELKGILASAGIRKSEAEKILDKFTSIRKDRREAVTGSLAEMREGEISEEMNLQAGAENIIASARAREEEAAQLLLDLQDGPIKTKLQEAYDKWKEISLKAEEIGIYDAGRKGGMVTYYLLLLAWVAFIGALNIVNKASAKKR